MNSSEHLPPAVLQGLAERFGTPLYVYDAQRIRAQIEALREAQRAASTRDASRRGFDRLRYAQKANANLAILRLIVGEGVALDAVSAFEVLRARSIGLPATQITFCADLLDDRAREVLAEEPVQVIAGSIDMLSELATLCPDARLWLRINPGFGVGHCAKVATGGASSKHGIWHTELPQALEQAQRLRLTVRGLHVHLGSGLDAHEHARAGECLASAARRCGRSLEVLSVGGGLGVPYRAGEAGFDLRANARAWADTRAAIEGELGRRIEWEIEPGRFLVAQAGLLLARVQATKTQGALRYALVDAGFHTLLRPAMYGAYHEIAPIFPRRGEPRDVVIAGPLCESGDVLSQADQGIATRRLPPLERGDLVVVHDAGAYGASMASRYNSQPLPAEVLIDGGEARLIRARESFEDVIRCERP